MQTRNLQKLGEGREAEIFAWEPGAVLKLYRTAGRAGSREIEQAALAAARAAQAPAPAALGAVEMEADPD